jgi:flavin reductase (DIM6/NTAB) family NADH-FMN oxidoreductase RutF
MTLTGEEFRRALGHFATGVTVVTVRRSQESIHGMTANAFTSVSLEPPLVLVCVDHRARSHPLLLEQKCFGINVLREDQEPLARYLDHETAGRLGVEYATSERGTPLLKDCLARLDCTLVATHEGGDHTLFVGRVEQANTGTGRPLLWWPGGSGHLGGKSIRAWTQRFQAREDVTATPWPTSSAGVS